jgi:hypothetical protein
MYLFVHLFTMYTGSSRFIGLAPTLQSPQVLGRQSPERGRGIGVEPCAYIGLMPARPIQIDMVNEETYQHDWH